VVLLGATAAKALLGGSFRVAPILSATIHPSAILRAPDEAARAAEREAFADDLRVVARALSR